MASERGSPRGVPERLQSRVFTKGVAGCPPSGRLEQDLGHPGVGCRVRERWQELPPASLGPKSGGGVECTSQDHLGEDFGNHFLSGSV